MLTEKQNIKLQQLSDLYFNNHKAIKEITTERLIEILKNNKWNLNDSFDKVMDYHNEIIIEKNRLWNLPKNVVRPFDNQGYKEIWSEFYKCPNCRKETLTLDHKENYCSNCGIEVDWSEIK